MNIWLWIVIDYDWKCRSGARVKQLILCHHSYLISFWTCKHPLIFTSWLLYPNTFKPWLIDLSAEYFYPVLLLAMDPQSELHSFLKSVLKYSLRVFSKNKWLKPDIVAWKHEKCHRSWHAVKYIHTNKQTNK